MSNVNLMASLEEMAEESIRWAVIGRPGEGSPPDPVPSGELLPWAEAGPYLDYDYDAGYGMIGCHAVWAWTEHWVVAINCYDGATEPYRIPRNPTAIMPEIVGGGV